MLNTDFINLPNVSFIQSNLPNLQTQEQLLRDRFEIEKANGYNFELVPLERKPNTIKFSNRFDLEDREYGQKELNDIFFALFKGLVDGIIRKADSIGARTIKLKYGMESITKAYGAEITDSKGYVLFMAPYKHLNYITEKEEISVPYLVGIILVDFDK